MIFFKLFLFFVVDTNAKKRTMSGQASAKDEEATHNTGGGIYSNVNSLYE